jgi:predicted glycosyltransferase
MRAGHDDRRRIAALIGKAMDEEAPYRHQKRVLLFSFDGGSGIGHLRRLSRIAKALQGPFSCLIVTSHRSPAHWFVPAECEYVHLPAWDSLLPEKAAYWAREPFITIGPEAALHLRRGLLQGIVDAFKPDVIIVDHLPLGMRGELKHIIENTECRKYLVTRAIQNETEDLARLLLAGEAYDSIKRHYDRVFVAIDQRVFDIGAHYQEFDDLRDKLCPVGYIIEPINREAIAGRRHARGLGPGDLWAVASAGGGQHGEETILACCELASAFKSVAFDVVLGPRSRLSPESLSGYVTAAGNLRLHKEVPDMGQFHAAADIVISSGGGQSLMEALQGHARIICVPSRKSEKDDQYVHAASLGRFAAIDVDIDVKQLPAMFAQAVASFRTERVVDRRGEIDVGGTANIKRIMLADVEAHADRGTG